jgi:CheY-like chemotaxis protein
MDHMMPKMDGIEAVKIIRGMGYSNGIIALTANAIIGREEMFLKSGFDGFIPKPIDTYELNLVLNNFILNKKPAEVVEAARKEQFKNNLMNTGLDRDVEQDMAKERDIAKFFTIDAENAIKILENLYTKINNFSEEEQELYNVTVHGMKSALANIGEIKLSGMAYKLEKAGIDKDTGLMSAETPALIDALKSIVEKLKPAKESIDLELSSDNLIFLNEKLSDLKTACATFNVNAVKAALSELRQMKWPEHIETVLDDISLYVLHSDFNKAAEKAEAAAKINV